MSGSFAKLNTLVGSPVERIEDLRFLRGRGQYVDDIVRDGLLHAAILRSSVAHGRIRSIDAAAARARPGVHAVITAADVLAALGAMPAIPLRQEQMPAFKPLRAAGDRARQGPLCRRAGRRCRRRQPGRCRGRAGGDRARHRAVAGGGRPAPRCGRQFACSTARLELRCDADRGARRRRCGIQGRALCPARTVSGAAPHRGADGGARPARRMGRRRAVT